jgi:hypothetical protein
VDTFQNIPNAFCVDSNAKRVAVALIWLLKVFVVVQQTRVRTSMISRAASMPECDKDVF